MQVTERARSSPGCYESDNPGSIVGRNALQHSREEALARPGGIVSPCRARA